MCTTSIQALVTHNAGSIAGALKSVAEAVNADLLKILDKVKLIRPTVVDDIVKFSMMNYTCLSELITFGIVYYNASGQLFFSHPFIMRMAYHERGINLYEGDWYSIEKSVPVLVQICSHEVTTIPQASTPKTVIIPQAHACFV